MQSQNSKQTSITFTLLIIHTHTHMADNILKVINQGCSLQRVWNYINFYALLLSSNHNRGEKKEKKANYFSDVF